jgi:hypothetical protein
MGGWEVEEEKEETH